MIGNLICKEQHRVSGLAKAARTAQEQARAYVVGPMGDGYEEQDEDEDASSDRAMAYDQRMKAEAYKGARKLTERWLIEDMEIRMAAAEYEELRAKSRRLQSAALTEELREVVFGLIRKEQDRAFEAMEIPRERSLDRVEEEFAHACRILPVREEWL